MSSLLSINYKHVEKEIREIIPPKNYPGIYLTKEVKDT